MNDKNKYEKFFNKVLNKMFSMVGLQPKEKEEFVKQEDWFLKRSWSKQDEENFAKYFRLQAKKDLKMNKKQSQKEFNWFNLCFGWKRNDYDKEL